LIKIIAKTRHSRTYFRRINELFTSREPPSQAIPDIPFDRSSIRIRCALGLG
jgi:hypothetical protein